jgi:hypothetical protein
MTSRSRSTAGSSHRPATWRIAVRSPWRNTSRKPYARSLGGTSIEPRKTAANNESEARRQIPSAPTPASSPLIEPSPRHGQAPHLVIFSQLPPRPGPPARPWVLVGFPSHQPPSSPPEPSRRIDLGRVGRGLPSRPGQPPPAHHRPAISRLSHSLMAPESRSRTLDIQAGLRLLIRHTARPYASPSSASNPCVMHSHVPSLLDHLPSGNWRAA